MTIVERTCPRCAIKRTVRWGESGALCFNCRLHWDCTPSSTAAINKGSGGSTAERTMQYPFRPAELLRLKSYRAAIHNGVYSDWQAARGNAALARPERETTQ